MFLVIKNVYIDDGIKGFFRGASMRMGYLFFGGFVYFGVYEKSKKTL